MDELSARDVPATAWDRLGFSRTQVPDWLRPRFPIKSLLSSICLNGAT